MSTIASRFFVTALDDGTTLHGALRSTAALVQAYNNGACIPDWETDDKKNNPTVYVTLLDGTSYVAPSTGTWSYNGTPISWESNGVSTDGKFQKVNNYTPMGYPSGVYVPAIQIIDNLASSSNVDQDIISFSGSREMSGAQIPFSAQIDVRITQWVTGGYLGVLSFEGGVADITTQNDQVTINAELYSDAQIGSDDFATAWYINGDSVVSTDSSADAYVNGHSLTVKEPAVIDYATIKCEFTYDDKLVYTAYIGVDDTQDPEYMYIFLGNNSGNSASLRRGETATFKAWVGKADDSQDKFTVWSVFKCLLLDSEGNVITDPIASESVDQDGYHTMSTVETGGTFDYATISIPYDYASGNGKSISGFIYASKGGQS